MRGAKTRSDISFLTVEPTFEEYVTARRVVLYVYEQLRQEKYKGQLCIASDEMLARIVHGSCPHYRRPLDENQPT